jgi:molybdopterin molybdotransferase
MLSVAEAQAIVLQHTRPLSPVQVTLGPGTLGQVLAEDIASDLDMPPFDKSLMDGYAVRAADLVDGKATLTVLEEVTAGMVPSKSVAAGQAIRIMTGAPLPPGADAVIMIERTQVTGDQVQIDDRPPTSGQNIMQRGREMRTGETVLTAGAVLRPQELGLLATVGRRFVRAIPRPHVAVLSTGDEIVEADQRPGPGQIRNGNGPMLVAQAARAAGMTEYLGNSPDNVDSLRTLVAQGLRAQMLVLTGGVSAGKLDLVPDVLRTQGVAAHFHKVAMKPGKPVFFGSTATCLVFGLPGNPVSSHVCFELFVRPALRRLAGHAHPGPRIVAAVLGQDFAYKTDRLTYHPARIDDDENGRVVLPVPWHGSPDLRGVTRANAFAIVEPGDHHFRAGARLPVMLSD